MLLLTPDATARTTVWASPVDIIVDAIARLAEPRYGAISH